MITQKHDLLTYRFVGGPMHNEFLAVEHASYVTIPVGRTQSGSYIQATYALTALRTQWGTVFYEFHFLKTSQVRAVGVK